MPEFITNLMKNLTPAQLQILATIGPAFGFLGGYIAAWTGIDQASATGILMAVIVLALTGYNLWMSRKSAQVSGVAKLPEVQAIELKKEEPAAAALEAVTPNNVVSK